jgi:hypothetical protein
MTITTERLIAVAKSQAKELKKDYDRRSEDLEDDSIAWTLIELSKRLAQAEKKLAKVKAQFEAAIA